MQGATSKQATSGVPNMNKLAYPKPPGCNMYVLVSSLYVPKLSDSTSAMRIPLCVASTNAERHAVNACVFSFRNNFLSSRCGSVATLSYSALWRCVTM